VCDQGIFASVTWQSFDDDFPGFGLHYWASDGIQWCLRAAASCAGWGHETSGVCCGETRIYWLPRWNVNRCRGRHVASVHDGRLRHCSKVVDGLGDEKVIWWRFVDWGWWLIIAAVGEDRRDRRVVPLWLVIPLDQISKETLTTMLS
jgi:hypothetical protein